MKIAFYTLGCKVNHYETEKLGGEFIAAGFEVVPFSERADVYVINTCTVTAVSGAKSRKAIARARKMNSEAIVAVMGCYSELEEIEADIVRGTKDREEIFNDIMKRVNLGEIGERVSDYKLSRTRASIKIQDGCDNFCAYCIIPHARGSEVFRGVDEVIAEAEGLDAAEMVLVGIHVSSHPNLREIVERLPAERVRLGSLEPHDLDGELIRWMGECEKLCPHFHLSLQSGCDSVLERMGRKYTFEEYYEKVSLFRAAIPNVSITTDVIVGFVGETDEEFEIGLENIRRCGFAKVHVFPYSVRERTLAADAEYIRRHGGLVAGEIKKERAGRLMAVAAEMRREFLEGMVGRRERIVWEKRGGYTGNYVRVRAAATPQNPPIFQNPLARVSLYTTTRLLSKSRRVLRRCRNGEFKAGELVEVEITGIGANGEECIGRVV